jgi:MFS family permease
MTEALGFDHATTSASLALFSAAQGASRVCTGIASEIALGWSPPRFCRCLLSSNDTGIPRPAFLVLASLVGAAAHFVLAISTSEGAFVFGVTLAGLSFGMVWPMMVLITGEFFGNRHVGANYMWFDGMSSAVGTLLISKVVAQEVYDEHIVREESGGEGNFKCTGLGCFAMTHAIVSLLSLTCIVSSFALIKNPWSQSSSCRDVAS